MAGNKKESSNSFRMSLELKSKKVEPGDVETLFEWANDPDARTNSIHPNAIPYEGHQAWFKSKILDVNYEMYWYLLASKKLGLIRIQRESDHGLLSIQIHPDQRGKGYGKAILRAATKEFLNRYNLKLHAEVLEKNLASRKLFTSCGYQEIASRSHGERNFIQFVIEAKDLEI